MLGPSYFSTMLGSTVDSCSYVRLRRLGRAQADFHGLAVQQTMVIPRLQLLNAVIDVPVVLVMQVRFLVVALRPFLIVMPVWQTIELPQLQFIDEVVYVPVMRVEQVS